MGLKSYFHQNNRKLSILFVLVLFSLTPLYAFKSAKSCEYRTFNIKTSNRVSNIDLLSQIADTCNFTIVVQDDIAKKSLKNKLSSININNLTLDELFDVLISDNDLYYKFKKNILKIYGLKTKTFKIDYITSIRNGTSVLNASVDATPTEEGSTRSVTGDNSIKSTETFDFWAKISSELVSVLNTGADEYKAEKPIINENAGVITITATKKQLDRVAQYIDIIRERLHKQVLINVKIISVDLENKSSTGIDWSKFDLTLGTDSNPNTATYNINGTGTNPLKSLTYANSYTVVGSGVFSMAGLMDFLATNGDTKVVSSPKVLTLNNQQALITVGDNINYRVPEDTTNNATATTTTTTTYTNYSIFIGVLLNITPEISDNNEIILRINPSVSNFKYTEDDGKQVLPREIAPDTSEKKLSTVVRVKDGSTLILGGLITNSKGVDHSSVPLLSDIPLLGSAFKYDGNSLTSQELIFVITPKIVGVKGSTKTSLRELGFSKRLYE
ncbi:pilus (MSHA type) biogenesis protein MshL [Sulfurospirillum sp. 1612]|uniref:pilus (MSHA type) biogenesis protein MshL n=1 Tax=Sulfurospirillum sp. 1612 TaxID=3094835 RepID=UPI002F95A4D2